MKGPGLVLALALCGLLGGWAGADCANPMLPADSDMVWVYAHHQGDLTDTYAVRRLADAQGNVTEESTAQGVPPERQYRCVAGAMQPLGTAVDLPGLDARVTAVRGTALGAPADWRVGGSWRYSLDLEATMQGAFKLSGPATLEVSFKVVALEPVTVAAGRYTAYRVEVTRTLSGKLGSLPYQKVTRQTDWYAPGVGLVRRESPGESSELLDLRGGPGG